MYNEKITEMFTQAIHDEFTSAIIYFKMGYAIRGLTATKVADEIIGHAKEEFDHAGQVIEYCANHGIDADLEYSIDEERINNSPTDVEGVIKETQNLETGAIELYNKIAQFAEDNRDYETREFATDLMIIEQGHFDDVALFTNQTRGFLNGISAMPIDRDSSNDKDAMIVAIPS